MFLRIFNIVAPVIFCLAFSTCRARNSNTQLESSTVQAPPAWFVGADKPLRICFQWSKKIDAQFPDHDAQLQLGTRIVLTYSKWIEYLRLKAIQPNIDFATARKIKKLPEFDEKSVLLFFPVSVDITKQSIAEITQQCAQPNQNNTEAAVNRAFPVGLAFVNNCEDADLEIHFGTKPNFIGTAPVDTDAEYAGVSLVNPFKPGGAIVLPDEGPSMKYSDWIESSVMLMHEFGHVFGASHIDGTIMDSNYLKDFFQDASRVRDVDPTLRQSVFTPDYVLSVDHWRQLVLCHQTPEQPELGTGLLPGTSFGVFQGFAAPSKSVGLSSYSFYLAGTNDYVAQINEQVIKSAQLDVENHSQIAEIFRRPKDVAAEPVFHESYVFNQWFEKKTFVKVSMNVNSPDRSNIEVVKDCPTAKFTAYENYYVGRYQPVLPRIWRPAGIDRYAENSIATFANCLGKDKDLLEFDASQFSKSYADANVNNFFKMAEAEPWRMSHTRPEPTYKLPSKHQWCGPFRGDKKLCVWIDGNLGAFQISGSEGYFQKELVPEISHYAKQETTFKEHWVSGLFFKTKMFPQGDAFPMRLGLKQDTSTNPDTVDYEVDVDLVLGMYFRLASGTLKRVN